MSYETPPSELELEPEIPNAHDRLHLHERFQHHLCCWMVKIMIAVPLIHFILHFMGVPHPEVLSFIP
jgi:hypothetical protein